MLDNSVGAALRGAGGDTDKPNIQQACQSLRLLLRSHLACGDAASAAFCTWTVAIVEGAPPHVQAMLLAAGILDVVFDRISQQLGVRPQHLWPLPPVRCM